MTIKEALITFIGVGVSDSSIGKALADAELEGTEEYSAANREAVEKASIDILYAYAVKSESEGDMSVTYDTEAMKSRLLLLCRKYNRQDILSAIMPAQPKIRASRLW